MDQDKVLICKEVIKSNYRSKNQALPRFTAGFMKQNPVYARLYGCDGRICVFVQVLSANPTNGMSEEIPEGVTGQKRLRPRHKFGRHKDSKYVYGLLVMAEGRPPAQKLYNQVRREHQL